MTEISKAHRDLLKQTGADDLEIARMWSAAERWAALARKHGGPNHAPSVTALQIARQHQREPIAFSVLLAFNDSDFAHDVGGVVHGDRLRSLRSARCYHPGRK